MANPKIQVDITADASKLKKGAGEAEQAIEKVDKAADKLGKGKGKDGLNSLGDTASNVAKDKLGPLGDIADKVGIDLDGMSAKSLAAGAGVVALGGFVAHGVTALGDMTDEVRKFKDTAGTTWETSSRLVAISDDLGISADSVSAAMGRLAKNIDAGKLEEFGIAVVKAKDGSVDMEATLGNVADAMNRTVDPTKKAAMGTALFGKSWADLQPLLQQGSSGIREMMAGVKDYQIQTAEGAQQQREFAMALDDIQDSLTGLSMGMAKGLLPLFTEVAQGLSLVTDEANRFSGNKSFWDGFQDFLNPGAGPSADRMRNYADGISGMTAAMNELIPSLAEGMVRAAATAEPLQAQADAEQAAADKADLLAAHQASAAAQAKVLSDAVKDQKSKLDELNNTVLTIAGTQLAADQATFNLNTTLADMEQKSIAVTEALAGTGQQSVETTEAANAYAAAVLSSQGAAITYANSQVDLAEKLATAAGQTFTAEQAQIVYREALIRARDSTTDPELIYGMNNLISLTDSAAASASHAAGSLNDMAAAASRAAAAAANAISIGSSGQITTSADTAERNLTPLMNRGAEFSTQRNTQVVQLIQDGRKTAEVVIPHFTTMERSRR